MTKVKPFPINVKREANTYMERNSESDRNDAFKRLRDQLLETTNLIEAISAQLYRNLNGTPQITAISEQDKQRHKL